MAGAGGQDRDVAGRDLERLAAVAAETVRARGPLLTPSASCTVA